MAAVESASHEVEAAAALNSILLKDEIWDECELGPAREWPQVLQNIAAFVLTLTHPAAIFWGPDLVMIYNEAWEGAARGTPKQGKSLDKSYSKDSIDALRTSLQDRIPRALGSSELLDHSEDESKQYPVICSPIRDKDKMAGVLVQVFCKRKSRKEDANDAPTAGEYKAAKDTRSKESDSKENWSQRMAKHSHHDQTALDHQPFFQKFAEMLPTGLAILNHKADPVFVNHKFYEMTSHRGENQGFKMWPETIHPEDYDRVMSDYQRAFESQSNMSAEFRAVGDDQWRLFLMRPLGDNSLQQWSLRHFGGFICALVDISSLKKAENAQRRVAEEAQERKEQQERFIDMISHEIRNPLSAVLHCAENILEAVHNGEAKSDNIAVDEIVEATNTISLCVAHQKNLVDDVLSFSKLDASMLSLAPKATKPRIQMADTLKIFQPELRKQAIGFNYSTDPTYQQTGVDWVMADIVRISQVLVNLMTNAIKFTAKRDHEKTISVRVAASVDRPDSYPPNVVFFQTEDKELKSDATGNPEWGDGEPLYILVAVKDTGIGISSENQARLFERFRQATPKTGQMYGGSGLGLNIARKLCQLHGGEIGVSSKEGEGSTFGFFFRVRRTAEPDDADKLDAGDVSEKLQTSGHPAPSEINNDDVSDSLKVDADDDFSETDKDGAPKDRWKETAGIAEQLNKQHKRSKSDEAERARQKSNAADEVAAKKKSEEKDPAKQDSSKISKNDAQKENSTSTSTPASPNKPKVLFVEDNLVNQKLLKRKIESKGFEVITADNGKQAVELVQSASSQNPNHRAFDCILMDQEMPIMDGKTASGEIRKWEKKEGLEPMNIIGVTANVRNEQQRDMTEAGMDDVIAKPFKMEELLGKMRRGSVGKQS